VLHGVTLFVRAGEIVAIIGHNGAGKSTLLKAIFGLLPVWEGSRMAMGRDLGSAGPREMLRAGVVYVPQGNRVFGDLTVGENLYVGGVVLGDATASCKGIERVVALFPALQSRLGQRAGTLSGGEKQMLALARALVLSPRVLLLDEPSLGLAPHLVRAAFGRLVEISRDFGVTVLMAEQKVRDTIRIAERVCVLRSGAVTFLGAANELRSDEERLRAVYF
jgi:ABC-type branched-subunit amino acid transport system ATPase component